MEWVAGSSVRYEWDERRSRLRLSGTARTTPEHYGCVPGALSPGDGDLLDVYVLRELPVQPGDRHSVRLIGVLLRSDGDHKLLAVRHSNQLITSYDQLSQERLDAVRLMVRRRHTVIGWAGPDTAYQVLAEARRVWALCHS